MQIKNTTAMVADDEPLLRQSLANALKAVWPTLDIVAFARNGREAVESFEQHHPQICFLDVHMPGMSGIEAARHIGAGAHLVFVTAFDKYALPAFDAGAVDYLLKPVEKARLQATVTRLQARLTAQQAPLDLAALLANLQPKAGLRFIRASIGSTIKLIAVDEIDYLRADSKYTTVAWRDRSGKPCEALIRSSLRDLLAELDPQRFVQVHRAVIVQLCAISHLQRHDNETASIHLHQRSETLPVSRGFVAQFRQM